MVKRKASQVLEDSDQDEEVSEEIFIATKLVQDVISIIMLYIPPCECGCAGEKRIIGCDISQCSDHNKCTCCESDVLTATIILREAG